MKKRIALTVVGLLVLVGVLGGVKALQIKDLIAAGESMQPPPTAVGAASVEAADWEMTLNSIGTVEAAKGVMVTADTPGRVKSLNFDGGERVEAGDLLLEQETATEQAQLSAARSELDLARSNLDRVSRLFETKVVSRSELDASQSALKAAQAQVENIESTIEKKRIVAPFSGRLGLRRVDIGQDLGQGVPIVSLQASEQMRVNFSLPQQALARVESGLTVRVQTNAIPDETFEGRISAIDTEIDSSTRSVRVQATLDNPQSADGRSALLPGMFVNVAVVLPDQRPVLMIPLMAVNFATYGDSVFLIEDPSQAQSSPESGSTAESGNASQQATSGQGESGQDTPEEGASQEAAAEQDTSEQDASQAAASSQEGSGSGGSGQGGSDQGEKLVARQQFVQLGERRGDFVEVTRGLQKGQRIASDGNFKLRNGAPVMIDENGTEPEIDPNPDNA